MFLSTWNGLHPITKNSEAPYSLSVRTLGGKPRQPCCELCLFPQSTVEVKLKVMDVSLPFSSQTLECRHWPFLSQWAPPMLFSLPWEARGIFQIVLFISGEQMFRSSWNHRKLIQKPQLITLLKLWDWEKTLKNTTPHVEGRPIYPVRVVPTANSFSLLSNSNQVHWLTWLMRRKQFWA